MLLRDENVNVVKKAILTMTQLYKVALQVRAPFPRGHPDLTGLIYGLFCQRSKPGSYQILSGKMCCCSLGRDNRDI